MSLNQIELNEIVLENLNQYYHMCSIPPVQRHFDEWLQIAAAKDLTEVFAIDTAERCWKSVWAFKHWYMQKYFGEHVDALMKITLEPDAFRYYVLRYRNDEERPARERNSGNGQDQPANIETSEPSSNQESHKPADLQEFVNNLEVKKIIPVPFICYHHVGDFAGYGCKYQCPYCVIKQSKELTPKTSESAQISPISQAPDTMEGSAAENSPADQSGTPAADHPGHADQTGTGLITIPKTTWCQSEFAGLEKCAEQCTICKHLPSPNEIKNTVDDFFANYKPGTTDL